MFATTLLSALGIVGATLAVPTAPKVQQRAVLAHDALFPIGARIQTGTAGDLIAAHAPSIHIAHGCEIYTAVDDEGNTNGGLQPSGNVRGGCRDKSRGQTYARLGVNNGQTAIMYSWYWPKDQTVDGVSTGAHRHDWENVVIWLDATNSSIAGGAASGHGDYKKTTGELPGVATPQVEYFTTFPTNHELQFTSTVGAVLAVSDWDAMPQAARDALQNTDFGSANVPFKDGTFESNLEKARL